MNATPAPRPPASRLEEALRSRRFVLTAEIVPPISFDPQDLLAKALPLKGLADAVNVTDGASARAHLCAPIAAATMVHARRIEPILQLVCRDRNRIGLQSDLMGAAALGVHNLLILAGDNPTAGDQPEAKAVFDLDSTPLTAMARQWAIRRSSPTGTQDCRPGELLHRRRRCADRSAPDWQPTSLAGKVDAGAEFAQTQFCMDAGDRTPLHRAARRQRGHADLAC